MNSKLTVCENYLKMSHFSLPTKRANFEFYRQKLQRTIMVLAPNGKLSQNVSNNMNFRAKIRIEVLNFCQKFPSNRKETC